MSQLVTKTSKSAPADAESVNARLLIQAGFIDQLMAGAYTFLPLGLRVLQKIQKIIREEMNAIGGQEILMPALQPAEPWKATGRWENPGPEVMFQFKGAGEREYGLGWTHEEIVTPLIHHFIKSYKDLPTAVYQIQDKFRNEARAKSGILRGREFNMKDLYSFHTSKEDMEKYYDVVKEAYRKIFARIGINAIVTEASGGAFSKFSHEFQMPTDAGEDIIFVNSSGDYAWNKEIVESLEDGGPAPDGSGPTKMMKAIEVGNIFMLQTRFTEPIAFLYTDEDGTQKPVYMGCYGIGPSRCMGAIVEASHDERGMIWPKAVAPLQVHLVSLSSRDEAVQGRTQETATALFDELSKAGVEVLWDDREGISAGEKLADADLIGIPLRLLVSEKTLKEESVEWKLRASTEAKLVKIEDVAEEVQTWIQE